MDDLENMKIRAGARLSFTIVRADSNAVSATYIAESDTDVISDTIPYDSDGKAAFQFDSPDTDVVGTYEYQVNENFSSGSPDIYPTADGCDGDDCGFPTLTICESKDGEVSS